MASTAVAKPVSDFDYAGVPAVDARKCRSAYDVICKRQRCMAVDIVAIGKELLAVKARLPHGLFGSWISHHFSWSDRTAQRMMRAAEVFGKTAKLSDLSVDQSALYLLSDESCPDDVREQIVKSAEPGTVISHAEVKRAIRDFVSEQNGDEEDSDVAPEPQVRHLEANKPIRTPTGEIVDELLEWSIAGFICSMRKEVNQWTTVCPVEERSQIV